MSPPRIVTIVLLLTAELVPLAGSQASFLCYELTHAAVAPANPAAAVNFPLEVALGAGENSGPVLSRANPADRSRFWEMFQNNRARWTRPAANRFELHFTNGFALVTYELNVKDEGDAVSGVAMVEFDIIGGDRPRFQVTGRRRNCPDVDR